MSRKNKLLIVLLSVVFCLSSFSLSAYAVDDNEGEGGYSDVNPGDNQGSEGNGSDIIDIPSDNGGDSGNGSSIDSSGNDNSVSNAGEDNDGNSFENNGNNYGDNNGDNNGDYIDNSSGGYENNNGIGDEYNYGDNNGDYSVDYGYEQNNFNDESSYLGGGQTYVEPEIIAPSASLYDSEDSIDEKTLNSGDWGDISKQLKNAGSVGDDGDDFSFIKNNNSKSDNGNWMLIAGIVCLALSAAGIAYFIVMTVQNNKRRKCIPAAVTTVRTSKSGNGRDYYGDGYKTNSGNKTKRRSKFDTAEVTLPKNTQGKRYKNSGRRYK